MYINLKRKQSGSVMVFVAVLVPLLFGIMALAIDGGYVYLQKTRLQSVADASVLACLLNATRCGNGGTDIFTEVNPYLDTPANVTVELENPVTCPKSTQAGCAKATATSTWHTFFMGLFGTSNANISAVAIAGRNSDSPACLITVGNISINGTNMVTMNSCSAAIGGNLNTTNQSGIDITGSDSNSITIYNGNPITNCGNCTPQPVGASGALPATPSYPIPTIPNAPAPTCNAVSKVCTYYPGTYTSSQKFNKSYSNVLTNASNSGVYVFSQGLDTNSSSVSNSAGGVSIYVPGDQVLKLTGIINLSAPTPQGCSLGSGVVISHPYNAIYHSLTIGGSTDHLNLTGVINLTADNLTVNGTSSSVLISGSLIGNSMVLNGNMLPSYSSNPCNNIYAAGRPILLN